MECKKKIKLLPTLFNNDTNKHEQYEQIQDRLSQLPDSILLDILSLVPIKTAASTSILSRHWRHLWTQFRATHLSLLFLNSLSFDSFECFITIVNHILSKIILSSKFRSFELNVPYIMSANLPISTLLFNNVLAPWIRHVCRHGPEEFKLRFEGFDFVAHMPICVLQTCSLVHLQLHLAPKMEFEIVNNSGAQFINLPNLKKIDMVFYKSQCSVMDTIFNSCPVLEDLDLCMHLTEECYDVINILASNLKRLFIQIPEISFGVKIVIDAPKLEYFDANSYLASYEFINIPINLQEARIIIEEDNIDEFDECILGLFRGISCVRSLIVLHKCAHVWEILDQVNDTNEKLIFHNLNHLSFMYLRKLPSFLLGNLKNLVIWDNGHHIIRAIDSLEHILRHASVLDKLHFFLDCNSIEYDDEKKLCETLYKLPKSSLCCEIAFSGPRIANSNKDYL